jgi:hypothetical protein
MAQETTSDDSSPQSHPPAEPPQVPQTQSAVITTPPFSRNDIGTYSSASSQQLPGSPADPLVHASQNMYPNIHTILRLICTLPVTSCECERSVSALRRLKTYLLSTMGQERLSGLALMHNHYGMQINLEEVIDIFAGKNPRRMMLMDPLH